jgi:hypothetical protein
MPDPKPSWSSGTPIRIRAFGLSPDEHARAYLRERVGFKLGKFDRLVQGLEIRLKDEGSSREEPLISCSLAVALAAGGPLLIERYADEPREAFEHAIGVAERLLRRRLQRFRHHDR